MPISWMHTLRLPLPDCTHGLSASLSNMSESSAALCAFEPTASAILGFMRDHAAVVLKAFFFGPRALSV